MGAVIPLINPPQDTLWVLPPFTSDDPYGNIGPFTAEIFSEGYFARAADADFKVSGPWHDVTDWSAITQGDFAEERDGYNGALKIATQAKATTDIASRMTPPNRLAFANWRHNGDETTYMISALYWFYPTLSEAVGKATQTLSEDGKITAGTEQLPEFIFAIVQGTRYRLYLDLDEYEVPPTE
jgi:hypothetical protein